MGNDIQSIKEKNTRLLKVMSDQKRIIMETLTDLKHGLDKLETKKKELDHKKESGSLKDKQEYDMFIKKYQECSEKINVKNKDFKKTFDNLFKRNLINVNEIKTFMSSFPHKEMVSCQPEDKNDDSGVVSLNSFRSFRSNRL